MSRNNLDTTNSSSRLVLNSGRMIDCAPAILRDLQITAFSGNLHPLARHMLVSISGWVCCRKQGIRSKSPRQFFPVLCTMHTKYKVKQHVCSWSSPPQIPQCNMCFSLQITPGSYLRKLPTNLARNGLNAKIGCVLVLCYDELEAFFAGVCSCKTPPSTIAANKQGCHQFCCESPPLLPHPRCFLPLAARLMDTLLHNSRSVGMFLAHLHVSYIS